MKAKGNRERIIEAVQDELPECVVKFAEESPDFTRFAIFGPSGMLISNAYPHLEEGDINALDDQRLRRYVMYLCGRRSSWHK